MGAVAPLCSRTPRRAMHPAVPSPLLNVWMHLFSISLYFTSYSFNAPHFFRPTPHFCLVLGRGRSVRGPTHVWFSCPTIFFHFLLLSFPSISLSAHPLTRDEFFVHLKDQLIPPLVNLLVIPASRIGSTLLHRMDSPEMT